MEQQTIKTDFKLDIMNILSPIFGERIKRLVELYYDAKNFSELYDLAYHLLVGYMGEDEADRILENLLKKYPKLKRQFSK